MQNKLRYAIHGRTAAELIADRADSEKPNLGLSTWESAPDGKVVRSDVTVGKNYLTKDELGRMVSAFLELAENRARRRIPMTMEDWARRLDDFLVFDDRNVLQDAVSVTKREADQRALDEFEKFRIVQDQRYVSDFDRFVQSVTEGDADPTADEDPEAES